MSLEGYIALPDQRTSDRFIYNEPFPDYCRAIYNGQTQFLSVAFKQCWEIPGFILDAHNAYWRYQSFLESKENDVFDSHALEIRSRDEEARYAEMQCRFNMDRIGGMWSCVFFQNEGTAHPRRVVASFTIISQG